MGDVTGSTSISRVQGQVRKAGVEEELTCKGRCDEQLRGIDEMCCSYFSQKMPLLYVFWLGVSSVMLS